MDLRKNIVLDLLDVYEEKYENIVKIKERFTCLNVIK